MNPFAKLTRQSILIALGVIALLIITAAGVVALSTPRLPANAVAVRRGDISAAVSASGKVRAARSARLSVTNGGFVMSVTKREGDTVNAGDVIITLRADDANRRVKQAELNLASRRLDLQRAKAAPRDEDIDIARANLQKATAASAVAEANYTATPTAQNDAIRLSTRADLDIARANFNRVVNGPTQEELDALQNAVSAAELEVEAAKAALAQTQVTAPYSSTVTEVDVREGELVGGYTQLAVIADLTRLEIATDIDEVDVAQATEGQTIEVRLDAFPGERFTGKLTRLFPAASTQRGSTTYSAIVDFDPRGIIVRPGMGATMRIQTHEKLDVLLVPNRALKSAGNRKAVHVVAPGNPRDVIVETGVTDGNETEIVGGLHEGDQIEVP